MNMIHFHFVRVPVFDSELPYRCLVALVSPTVVVDFELLEEYFAEGYHTDAWVAASYTKVSFTRADVKDFYSNNTQELEKYRVVPASFV
ncbi:hypothetical protein BGX27_010087 [Mortierella sp. AM989]|nr:hypothetical protein BGX27_010087 [Mortierella sp. AM989]